MDGRELVFALAPEAGQGAVRKVEVERADVRLTQCPPLPSPLPTGERGQAECGEREQPELAGQSAEESAPTPDLSSPRLADARGGGETLMARVQALYEDSAVPVREIARLCGVTERTLYRYVETGGWRRRYIVRPRGQAAAASNRGRRWQRASGLEPVTGAGGRFIARAEAERPAVHGLKALDPGARARAATSCAAAGSRAAKAWARADKRQVWEARIAAINAVSAAMAAYNRFRATRGTDRSPVARARDNGTEDLYLAQIEAALACVRKLRL